MSQLARAGSLAELRELERLVSQPIDLDFERWRAARRAYVVDRGRVHRVPRIGGGSFTTGTQAEVVYSNQNAGTAKNTFTAEAQINDTAGMGTQCVIPKQVWYSNTVRTATVRVTARGILSSTATPSYTFTCRFVSTAGVIVAGTAALVTLTTVTSKLWEMEWDTQVVTMAGAGNNSTVRSSGLLSSPAGLASPGVYEVWGNATQPGTVATVDPTIDNLLFVDVTSTASSASNGLTLLQLIAQGQN